MNKRFCAYGGSLLQSLDEDDDVANEVNDDNEDKDDANDEGYTDDIKYADDADYMEHPDVLINADDAYITDHEVNIDIADNTDDGGNYNNGENDKDEVDVFGDSSRLEELLGYFSNPIQKRIANMERKKSYF